MKNFDPFNQVRQNPVGLSIENAAYVTLKKSQTLDVSEPAPYAKTRAFAASPRSMRRMEVHRGTVLKVLSRHGKRLRMTSKDGWEFIVEKDLLQPFRG